MLIIIFNMIYFQDNFYIDLLILFKNLHLNNEVENEQFVNKIESIIKFKN